MNEVKTWLAEFLEIQEVKNLFAENYLAQQQLVLILDKAEFMLDVGSSNLNESKPLPWKFEFREGYLESISVDRYSKHLYFLDDMNKLLHTFLYRDCAS